MDVLIADDDAQIRSALTMLLEEAGHRVTATSDGAEAWSVLSGAGAPRLAILDWAMPGLTGVDICRMLREREMKSAAAEHTHVILLTGKNDVSDVVRGLESGADDFVAKPFHEGELRQRIAIGARLIANERILASRNRQLAAEIEERRKTEAKRLLLESRLQEARHTEAMGSLASGLAHEINTPLQFVGDNLAFIEEGVAALVSGGELRQDYLAELPKAVEQSRDGLRRMSEIVVAMIEFSRGGQATSPVEMDLDRLIENAAEVSRHVWQKVARLNVSIDQALPKVMCVPGDVRQAITCLLARAADAVSMNGRGGGTISIRAESGKGVAVVTVADDGAPIDAAQMKTLFDLLAMTESATEAGRRLPLVHAAIVRRNGGRMTCESNGNGTVFRIELPTAGGRRET